MSESAPRRVNDVFLAAVAIVVVGAIVVVAMLKSLREVEYPEGSAQAAAQTYLRAMMTGDTSTAYGMLSPDLREQCSLAEFAVSLEEFGAVYFDAVTVQGDQVIIDVRLEPRRFDLDPFPGEGWETSTWLTMEMSGDAWQVKDAFWPLYNCAWR